jgi:hypothetical protein
LSSKGSPGQSVLNFSSSSAHNRQESPFWLVECERERTSVESDIVYASARLTCRLRTVCAGTVDGPRPGNSRQSALLAQTVSGLVVRTVRGQGPDGPGPDTQILNLCPFSDSKIQMGFERELGLHLVPK